MKVIITVVCLITVTTASKPHRLGSFSLKNCGDPKKESFLLNKLTVKPDPVVLPGSITIGFSGDNKAVANSPVPADVVIEKKVAGTWVKLPCIDQFGSCHYDDFCEILSMIPQCPDPLVQAGIPCHCPFKVANYTLPDTTFDIDISILPPGDYTASINATMNGKSVGCYVITVTFA